MPCLLQSFVKILTALFHVCMLSDENNPSLVKRPVTKSVCAKRVREVECSCVTKRLPAHGRVDRGGCLSFERDVGRKMLVGRLKRKTLKDTNLDKKRRINSKLFVLQAK